MTLLENKIEFAYVDNKRICTRCLTERIFMVPFGHDNYITGLGWRRLKRWMGRTIPSFRIALAMEKEHEQKYHNQKHPHITIIIIVPIE
jgi:hypothetical protein